MGEIAFIKGEAYSFSARCLSFANIIHINRKEFLEGITI